MARLIKVESFGDHIKDRRGGRRRKSRIRLKGRWLRDAGFNPGDYAVIDVDRARRRIVISVCPF